VAEGERSLAIFIDFENLALGFQGRRERFDIARVLERLVEKGKIVAKKAYADWNRFAGFTAALHESAIELIEIPRRAQSGKNSADIRLCVDAMDLAYSKEHINTFVVLSGDSDFSPLVSKLKELGKHVIGLGMQESTSDLLRDNCDEFIYYEDLGQNAAVASSIDTHLPETKRKAFALLLESLLALRRENKEVLWSSMIKDTMKRKKPSFNETYHGYRTFSELLEDAQQEGLLELDTDKRSRTYVVTRFGSELHPDKPAMIGPGEPHPVPSTSVPHSRPGPMIAIPSRPGAPTGGSGPRPVIGPSIAVPGGMSPAEAMMPPGRRKSRRRRRRGQGGVVNGVNGPGVPPGVSPRDMSPEAAPAVASSFTAGIELPPAVEATAPEAEQQPAAKERPKPELVQAEPDPETEAPEARAVETKEVPEAKAPAKPRRRAATGSRTSRSGSSTRTRKSSASGESGKKAAEGAGSKEKPN
jgi:uncharacterized protein (TIGR00288 family)